MFILKISLIHYMYFCLRMNVTYKQREMLLNYIELHRELLQGRLSRKSESRRTMVLYYCIMCYIKNMLILIEMYT